MTLIRLGGLEAARLASPLLSAGKAQRFDRAVAGIGDAEFGAGLHQRVVQRGGELARHMQFPAELAHIGHS